MARVLITGSTIGLGKAAAAALLDDGHEVVLHARSAQRAADVDDLARRATGLVIGDLASGAETRDVAKQANAIGSIDAVIHNAGVYDEPRRNTTADGHARTLAVNALAPYVLTVCIERPTRLVYISSGMHMHGEGALRDIDWKERRWDGIQA